MPVKPEVTGFAVEMGAEEEAPPTQVRKRGQEKAVRGSKGANDFRTLMMHAHSVLILLVTHSNVLFGKRLLNLIFLLKNIREIQEEGLSLSEGRVPPIGAFAALL